MAKNDDNEKNADPDYDAAAKLIKAAIQTANDVKSKALGDLSAAWARVQDHCNVNKAAAKDVLKLLNKSPSSRNEYLRDHEGMLKALGLEFNPDLVDMADDEDMA